MDRHALGHHPFASSCLWTTLSAISSIVDFSLASRGCRAAAAERRGSCSSTAALTASQVSLRLLVVILSGKLGAWHKVSQEATVQSATSLDGGLGSASLETNTATQPARCEDSHLETYCDRGTRFQRLLFIAEHMIILTARTRQYSNKSRLVGFSRERHALLALPLDPTSPAHARP